MTLEIKLCIKFIREQKCIILLHFIVRTFYNRTEVKYL